jgi:hypothetical protein
MKEKKMSKETLELFLKTAGKDDGMVGELHRAVGEKTGEAARKAVVDFADTRGFAVTVEDLEVMGEGPEPEGELSETQLDQVAGGDVPDNMLSLLSALRASTSPF